MGKVHVSWARSISFFRGQGPKVVHEFLGLANEYWAFQPPKKLVGKFFVGKVQKFVAKGV